MLALMLFTLSGLFAFLAVDAWRLRSQRQLPPSVLAKLRGYPPRVQSLEEIERAKTTEGVIGSGNRHYMFVVFALVSAAFLVGGLAAL